MLKKSYDRVIEYVQSHILRGDYKIGDKLPSERELSALLGMSRNSVREGIRILERMGVLSSQQGSGNYIAGNFDDVLTDVLSMMYALQEVEIEQITDFRYGLEYAALHLAMYHITEVQKEEMRYHLDCLRDAEIDDIWLKHDKRIHYLLIEASQNKYLSENYIALNNIMDLYIPTMRGKILTAMKTQDYLYNAHELIVEGILENNLPKSIEGLSLHFKYLKDYQ